MLSDIAIDIAIDHAGPVAPYEQIRDQVVAAITAGRLPTGARLPTVRRLAADLGLAVNTVSKAYRALETEGHVVTQGRNGTVVQAGHAHQGDPVGAAAAALVAAARTAGLDLPEAIGILRRTW